MTKICAVAVMWNEPSAGTFVPEVDVRLFWEKSAADRYAREQRQELIDEGLEGSVELFEREVE